MFDVTARHPDTQQLYKFFAYAHLPIGLQGISKPCCETACIGNAFARYWKGPPMTTPRTILYENTHVLIDALLDPAGGLTLRCLTTGKGMADGYHVVLTIDETQALRDLLSPQTCASMVEYLRAAGYIVHAPLDDIEPLLEHLARQCGYGLVRPAYATEPTPPQPAIVSHAELTQRMAQAIDHRDEALAARNGERLTLHEARIQATQVAEDAEEVYCRALAEDIVRVGTEIDQWMHALRKEKPFPRAAETVLAHCVDADQARQGVAVATEIRALLTHYRIPADSPYRDWSSELAKHEPQRWPDTTA